MICAMVAVTAMASADGVKAERRLLTRQAPAKYIRMQNPSANDAEGFKVGQRIICREVRPLP